MSNIENPTDNPNPDEQKPTDSSKASLDNYNDGFYEDLPQLSEKQWDEESRRILAEKADQMRHIDSLTIWTE